MQILILNMKNGKNLPIKVSHYSTKEFLLDIKNQFPNITFEFDDLLYVVLADLYKHLSKAVLDQNETQYLSIIGFINDVMSKCDSEIENAIVIEIFNAAFYENEGEVINVLSKYLKNKALDLFVNQRQCF